MMDEQLVSVLSTSLRVLVMAGPNMALIVYMYACVFKRKRSMLWAVAFFSFKVLIHSVLIQTILEPYYRDTQWWNLLNTICIWRLAILLFGLYCWIFDAEVLKIAVVAVVGEIIGGLILFTCIALINILEGRENVWAYAVEFELPDVLIPILEAAVILSLCRLSASWLEKIRNYRIVHRKLLWAVFILYVGVSSLSLFNSFKTLEGGLFLVFMAMAVVIVMIVVIYRYSKKTQREREFLNVRQRLGQTHYETIQRQIRQMEKSRQIIDAQMEEIRQMAEPEEFDSETVASYLEQIRDVHEEIHAGIYCDDWMIDALLYSQTSLFEKEGKKLVCSMQGYTEGRLTGEDVVQILTLLLEYAKQADAGEEILLHVTTIGKQIVAELVTAERGKERLLKRKLKPYLKKYDGTLLWQQAEGKYKVAAVF